MANIALILERFKAEPIAAAQPVVFECNQYSSGNIDYDTGTGIITFNEAGRYLVNWWVATQSSTSFTGVAFELIASDSLASVGNSPMKTGQVSGMGIIEVTVPPATLTLNNATASSIYLSTLVPTAAMLTVFSDDIGSGSSTSSYCFGMAQLAHVIGQLIKLYPTSTMSVFTTNLNIVIGTPYQLYTSPATEGAGFFVLLDAYKQPNAIPLNKITAIYTGDGTSYDKSMNYLIPPSPLPNG